MKASDNLILINLLGKPYKIKCPPESAQALQHAAEYLDEQMKNFQQVSSTTTLDQVLVVAALNICHELLLLKKDKNQYIDSMHSKINSLQKRIENFLVTEEEVAI